MEKIRVMEAVFENSDAGKPTEIRDVVNFSPLNYDYSKLSSNFVLFIAGAVDVSGIKYKQSKYPLDFSNVYVTNFDCHGAANVVALPRVVINHLNLSGNKVFNISSSTKWPLETQSIDVSHSSVHDLSVFFTKINRKTYITLPPELKELVIDNKIKENTSPKILKLFLSAYPNLTITTKYIPLDRLASNDKNIIIRNGREIVLKKKISKTEKTTTPVLPQPVNVSVKDSEKEMDITDIENTIGNDVDIKSLNLSKNELNRYIRAAIAGINKFNRTRSEFDDVVITCILRSDFKPENIKQYILQQKAIVAEQKMKENASRFVVKKKGTNKDKIAPETKKQIETSKIAKYMPQAIWKQIKAECGDDVVRQRQTLENIQRINITSWNIKDGPIPFVDSDGDITHSKTARKHGFRCISQSLGNDSPKSAPRILWSCSNDGLTFVAIAFFSDHTKQRLAYKQVIQSARDGCDATNVPIDFENIGTKQNILEVQNILLNEFASTTNMVTAMFTVNTK